MQGVILNAFEADIRKRWLIERGVEIISEASRRLPDDLRARHPEIPWRKVAGIGNVLRHDYEDIAAPVMWKLVHDDLPALEAVCRAELAVAWNSPTIRRHKRTFGKRGTEVREVRLHVVTRKAVTHTGNEVPIGSPLSW